MMPNADLGPSINDRYTSWTERLSVLLRSYLHICLRRIPDGRGTQRNHREQRTVGHLGVFPERFLQNAALSLAPKWFSALICQVLLQKNLTDFRGAPILSTWEDAPHRQKVQAGSWPSSASRSNAAANGCGGLTTSGTCPSRPSPRPSRA